MTVTTKDGNEIPVTLSASIITIDGKEIGSVGVFTDMREILKMRRELEDTNIQLIQSQKIASIGRMAAGVAHEINNPLSAILIYAELLKESLKGHFDHSKDLQEIIDQTLRCKKIVSDLLEFSRKSAGKSSSFSLEHLVSKCLALLINKANFQNIEVSQDFDQDMPSMVGDMSQLQQVFTNLFINAADAMEGRGELRVGAHYDSDRRMFTVTISDTGPGIPQANLGRIFNPFFTTKPVGKGTGLGLAICYGIVKKLGGEIEVRSELDVGTTFKVILPFAPVKTAETDTAPGEKPTGDASPGPSN